MYKVFKIFLIRNISVCSDELTHKLKGFTVMTDEERYQSLLHSRYVDEVIMDAPWLISKEFLDLHKVHVIKIMFSEYYQSLN